LSNVKIIVFWDVMLYGVVCRWHVLEEPVYQTTQHHIPEDSSHYSHHCEDLKSCMSNIRFLNV
jgi:hypothetical protein